jgi:CheY-like chemotaxis protein
MNGILGFTDLLKEPKLSGEQQLKYIGLIEKSGTRMLNIINDIVDVSKIESGQMKVEIKESNINEQIEYLYTFFKPECESKGIHLTMKNSLPSNQSIIKTDREKVFAILTNLIKNAIKYSNHGIIEFGYALVETHHAASTKETVHAASLQFFVKDQGIGIPRDRQEAIFERFIQADIEDRNAYQGAGLGLAISKSYVEMLGGKIWVESEVGKGSTFFFTLPYSNAGEAQNALKGTKSVNNDKNTFRKLKILVAEDDGTSEKLISIYLQPFSKQLLFARTGGEAVETCRNNPDIDLVLMDIQMPHMNGYMATNQIRQFNQEAIIIAQTAFGLQGDREKALEAGCNDYISKPIAYHSLLNLIQKYLN